MTFYHHCLAPNRPIEPQNKLLSTNSLLTDNRLWSCYYLGWELTKNHPITHPVPESEGLSPLDDISLSSPLCCNCQLSQSGAELGTRTTQTNQFIPGKADNEVFVSVFLLCSAQSSQSPRIVKRNKPSFSRPDTLSATAASMDGWMDGSDVANNRMQTTRRSHTCESMWIGNCALAITGAADTLKPLFT